MPNQCSAQGCRGYGYPHMDLHTHGIGMGMGILFSSVGIHIWIPIWISIWEFPQKSCGNGNGNSLPTATLALLLGVGVITEGNHIRTPVFKLPATPTTLRDQWLNALHRENIDT